MHFDSTNNIWGRAKNPYNHARTTVIIKNLIIREDPQVEVLEWWLLKLLHYQ
jgi:hypothetical protein